MKNMNLGDKVDWDPMFRTKIQSMSSAYIKDERGTIFWQKGEFQQFWRMSTNLLHSHGSEQAIIWSTTQEPIVAAYYLVWDYITDHRQN